MVKKKVISFSIKIRKQNTFAKNPNFAKWKNNICMHRAIYKNKKEEEKEKIGVEGKEKQEEEEGKEKEEWL